MELLFKSASLDVLVAFHPNVRFVLRILLKRWVHSAGLCNFISSKDQIITWTYESWKCVNPHWCLLSTTRVTLYTLRHNSRFKLCPDPNLPTWFRASLGGQKYHASPHKAMFNKKGDAMGGWGGIKGLYSEKNREEVKGA